MNLNVKDQAIKLLEEKNSRKYSRPTVRQRALRLDTKDMLHKEKSDKLDLTKFINLLIKRYH